MPKALAELRVEGYVGCEDSCDSIAAFVGRRGRRCGLVVVTGEAGIGKSSLLVATAELLADQGSVLMFGRCVSEASLPLAPIIELLQGDGGWSLDAIGLHPLGYSALLRCIDDHSTHESAPRLGDAQLERRHLRAAIDEVLRWHAGSSPMVLMIDDLHWADIETIEVLGHLMDGEWPGGLTIVVAARSDTGPWQRLVAEAIEHQHCLSVPLAGLRREGVAELARTRFGVAESDRIAFDVHRQTGGNPLLVGAVLDDLASHEALLAAGVPSRVSLLAAGRMAQLDQAATLVLHAASAAGTSVSTSLLATVLALDEQAVARSIAAGHAQHLLTINIEKATSVRFSHDLYRQAVYESMSFDRREALHTRFAAYFDERRSSAGVAADHWQRAGRPIEAARSLLAKAHGERSMLQRSAALRSVVLGLELAGADDVPDELVVELLELKLELLIEGGQSSEAAEVVRDARQLVRRGTVAYLRLERLSAKMAEVACRWEDASEGFRHCLSEITYLGGPSASIEIASEWCNVQIDLVWLRYRSPIANSPPQVDVDSALERVAELGTAQQRADVAQAAAAVENQRCRFVSSERALHLAHRALLASNELNDPVLIADKTFSVGFQLLGLRRLDEAEERFNTALGIFTDIGADARLLLSLVYLSVVSRFRGDVAATRLRSVVALEAAESAESPFYVAASHANIGWSAWREGRHGEAQHESVAALDRWVMPRWTSYPFQGVTCVHPSGAALLPRLARSTGDLVNATLWVTYCDRRECSCRIISGRCGCWCGVALSWHSWWLDWKQQLDWAQRCGVPRRWRQQ